MLIELNRPEKRNALNNATLQELVTLLKSVDADSSIKTVVITGNESCFAAGADLNELVLCIEKSLKETQLEDRLELDRRIGQLLGYSTQDIEFYIQHISNRHLKTKI